mmetsp:Transcript_113421/g.315809  ORF Transcript_113421/g.315809 Transcript_113421/m.315809 type:complete len:248 (+) Transcript_113421:1671-2414(+)
MAGSAVTRWFAWSPRNALMSAIVALNGKPRNCTVDGLRPSSSVRPTPPSPASAELSSTVLALPRVAATASLALAPVASPPGAALPGGAPVVDAEGSPLPPGRGNLPTVNMICSSPGSPETSKRPGKPRSHLQMLSVSSARRRSAGGKRSRISASAMLRPGHRLRFDMSRARISLSLGTASSAKLSSTDGGGCCGTASAASEEVACCDPSGASLSLLMALASPPATATGRLCFSPIAGHPGVSPMDWP